MPPSAIDLTVFDRDVRRAAGRVEQLRAWLDAGTTEARDKARSFDPFEGVRHTTTMSSYRSLQELEPSAVELPQPRSNKIRCTIGWRSGRACNVSSEIGPGPVGNNDFDAGTS